MKTKNLTVGMKIRNYPDLCALIDEKASTGKSKQLQIKRWEQYFRYHRDGYAFIIDEIYEQPLSSSPRKLRSDNIYTELIEKILISKLKTEHEIRIGKNKLYQILGFFNENYADVNSSTFKNTMRQFRKKASTDV